MNSTPKSRALVESILVLAIVIVGWMYADTRRDVHDLRDRVHDTESAFENQRELFKTALPPSGETDTDTWNVIENDQYGFLMRYPQDWAIRSGGTNILMPERFSQDDVDVKDEPLLSLTTSSNTEISSDWQVITLSSGTEAFYSLEDGFDHYYISNGDSMLVWSIPVRSYHGIYSNDEIQRATQIVNTFRKL